MTESGTYSITPELSKGLELNRENGELSGTPEEEYFGSFYISFTSDSGETKTATIYISGIYIYYIIVYQVPTEINYGFTVFNANNKITGIYSCTTDHVATEFSMRAEPITQAITIDRTYGTLTFNEYDPDDNEELKYNILIYRVTVTAKNIAGEYSTTLTINRINEVIYVTGIRVTTSYHNNYFYCGDEVPEEVTSSISKIWDNLQDLNDTTNYGTWNTRLDGWLTSHGYYAFEFLMDGYIHISRSGTFDFYLQIGYSTVEVTVDGEKIIDKMDECQTDYSNVLKGSKELSNGLKRVQIHGFITDRGVRNTTGYPGRYQFSFKQSNGGDTTLYDPEFMYCIIIYI